MAQRDHGLHTDFDGEHQLPKPLPRLNLWEKFLLKFYFKTKPAWEYSEAERQAISARYRTKR